MKFLESSSFVYGSVGFVDKVSCGLAFMVLQNNSPVKLNPCQHRCDYFKHVLAGTCGGCCLFGLIGIGLLYPFQIGKR